MVVIHSDGCSSIVMKGPVQRGTQFVMYGLD